MITQIAQHLNILESAIAQVEEWANVLFVRFIKGSPRFVSKKVKEKEMTKLEGSDKQVKWANDIRNQLIEDIKSENDDTKQKWLNNILPETDASWWIDNRKQLKGMANAYKQEIEAYGKIRTEKEKWEERVDQEIAKLQEMVSRKNKSNSFGERKMKALVNNWNLVKDKNEAFFQDYKPVDPYLTSITSEVFQMVKNASNTPYTVKDF